MANAQKRKGDAAEREAAQLIAALLALPARRKLGAGRTNGSSRGSWIRSQPVLFQKSNPPIRRE